MLKFMLQLLPLLLLILKRIFAKRDKLKTAEEALGETSYTKTAVDTAEAAADEKFPKA